MVDGLKEPLALPWRLRGWVIDATWLRLVAHRQRRRPRLCGGRSSLLTTASRGRRLNRELQGQPVPHCHLALFFDEPADVGIQKDDEHRLRRSQRRSGRQEAAQGLSPAARS
jgi:hypothetical protein